MVMWSMTGGVRHHLRREEIEVKPYTKQRCQDTSAPLPSNVDLHGVKEPTSPEAHTRGSPQK